MLHLTLLTPNTQAANSIQHMVHESSVFKLILRGEPLPPIQQIVRIVGVHGPELVLLDLNEWDTVSRIALEIRERNPGGVVIGFKTAWTKAEKLEFQEAGVTDLLHDPFSPAELEAVAYEALHRERPVANSNIIVFLPAKAGGGCSTVALNTAGALVKTLGKKVLLVESDIRSGVLSTVLNQENRTGLREVLERAAELTPLEWQQHHTEVCGIDLILANPARRGPLPRWNDYYQLLYFLRKKYDFILADLPEVINDATAEIVRAAGGVVTVCEPELPSLKLAKQRCAELESCEIPRDKIHIVINRWENNMMQLKDVEEALERRVFTTIPNDYLGVKEAVMKSGLVSEQSPFTKGCEALARKLCGLPEAPMERSKFALLQRLGRIANN